MALMLAASIENVAKPGKLLKVKGAGKTFVLANVAGALYCLDGICMKDGCVLAEGKLEGHLLTCSWHGTQFDVRTGAVLRSAPHQYGIVVNLGFHQVVVKDGEGFIDI